VHRGLPSPNPTYTGRLEGTKTDKHRTVQLVPQAVAALVCYRERQGVERVVAGDGCADYDFVFAGPSGGPLRTDLVQAVRPCRRDSRDAADAAVRCAAYLCSVAAGGGGAVEGRAGSARAQHDCLTADLYSHVRPEMAHRAMARLAAFVEDTDETRTAE
jgi:hypothetical protein